MSRYSHWKRVDNDDLENTLGMLTRIMYKTPTGDGQGMPIEGIYIEENIVTILLANGQIFQIKEMEIA